MSCRHGWGEGSRKCLTGHMYSIYKVTRFSQLAEAVKFGAKGGGFRLTGFRETEGGAWHGSRRRRCGG